ncbi:MAG: hypothetical protein U9N87_08085, partial [Planctomycetota bacterium]|nr:hypothetical protein [Planctomycetota bacterium]
MWIYRVICTGCLIAAAVLAADAARAEKRWNGEPGVLHQVAPARGTMVCRDDGSIIMFAGKQGRVSTDGGRTWGTPFALKAKDGADISHGSVS